VEQNRTGDDVALTKREGGARPLGGWSTREWIKRQYHNKGRKRERGATSRNIEGVAILMDG